MAGPIFVLWKTAMPAALIEIGFMSNATDLASMRTESGREKIAQDIYVAFSVFKKDMTAVSMSKLALRLLPPSLLSPKLPGKTLRLLSMQVR